MANGGQAPGFYGKLPSHGDFVGRRFPPALLRCVDDWLQSALVYSRMDLGSDWLATWGSSPLWRFVIAAGVCGKEAWAGVMMPSADRVGRCFPLLLAAPLGATPSLRDCLAAQNEWFALLEDVALSALDKEFSMEAFDAELVAFRGACFASASSADWGARQASVANHARVSVLDSAMDAPNTLADAFSDGQSAWWTEGSRLVSPVLAICDALPSATRFVALLDGRWATHGWKVELAKPDRRPL